jgi:hypothetical protein
LTLTTTMIDQTSRGDSELSALTKRQYIQISGQLKAIYSGLHIRAHVYAHAHTGVFAQTT